MVVMTETALMSVSEYACHLSVSETTIPNLAAQRVGYLEAQLKAFKDGTRARHRPRQVRRLS